MKYIEEKTIEEIANLVIKGEFGNGDERKKNLGDLYPIVQNEVNEKLGCSYRHEYNEKSIELLAKRIIKGEFGNDEKRTEKFGDLYSFLKDKVDEILNSPAKNEV